MKPLTSEQIQELSQTRNGFYSWDYVARLASRVVELEAERKWIPVSEFDIKEDGIYLYIDTRDQLQLSYFYAKDRRKFAHYVKQIYTMQIILPEWEEKQEGE